MGREPIQHCFNVSKDNINWKESAFNRTNGAITQAEVDRLKESYFNGARPLANSGGRSQEATRTAQATEEGQVSRPYIGTPPQEQAISSPLTAVEAGLLPKLSSGQLCRSET